MSLPGVIPTTYEKKPVEGLPSYKEYEQMVVSLLTTNIEIGLGIWHIPRVVRYLRASPRKAGNPTASLTFTLASKSAIASQETQQETCKNKKTKNKKNHLLKNKKTHEELSHWVEFSIPKKIWILGEF